MLDDKRLLMLDGERVDKGDEGSPTHNGERVGKGRPPRSSRWKPGQSGNPKGRPKGSKNLMTLFGELFDMKVTIRERGAVRKVTGREALVRVLYQKAINGDLKAIEQLLAQEPRVQRARRDLKVITSAMTPQESAAIYAQIMHDVPEEY